MITKQNLKSNRQLIYQEVNILVNIGVKNYDDDENNDKSEDIKNGLLNDFNDLIFFGFSENPFKAPNLSFDRRFKTVYWFRTTVSSEHLDISIPGSQLLTGFFSEILFRIQNIVKSAIKYWQLYQFN